jgi:hypothetical protein
MEQVDLVLTASGSSHLVLGSRVGLVTGNVASVLPVDAVVLRQAHVLRAVAGMWSGSRGSFPLPLLHRRQRVVLVPANVEPPRF